jgi:hypothetical protein
MGLTQKEIIEEQDILIRDLNAEIDTLKIKLKQKRLDIPADEHARRLARMWARTLMFSVIAIMSALTGGCFVDGYWAYHLRTIDEDHKHVPWMQRPVNETSLTQQAIRELDKEKQGE